jgi:hypothetical protein
MGKISIITPTIRPEGLETVLLALKRQTFKDWEWLVGSPFDPDLRAVKWVKDDFEGGYWTLNRIYNKLIKESQGELIISWQDFTFADPTALEKFWTHYENYPIGFVSAVGNKYLSVYPELGEMVWKDPRETDKNGSFYECFPNDVEWNLSSVPRVAMYDVGGFDEALDFRGFGMDGFYVNQRLDKLGYKFFLDQTLKSYSLTHGRVENWDEHNLIKEMDRISYPNPRLEYLK